MNLNLEGIANLSTPIPGSTNESFVTAFFNNIYSKVGVWLADAGNGIAKIFATDIESNKSITENLCVKNTNGETCITRDQLDTLLSNTSSSGSSSSSGGDSTPPPPAPEPTPSPTCTDGIQNQDETGVDTGGVCGGSSGGTPAETCSDGIQNQDETGVDTGGVCGGGGNAPAETCSDGIQNQDETGVDTGGVCSTPSDVSALTTAKATAQGLIDANASESENSGDHVVGSLATLISANNSANATTADDQSVVDAQVATLNDATSLYNVAIVP